MKTKTSAKSTLPTPSLAATIAPEDVQVGMYVTLLYQMEEYPPYLWESLGGFASQEEPVRMRCISRDSGTPLRVKAICLPFLLVKLPNNQCQTVDLRRVQLAKLDESYAKYVWKHLQNPPSHGCDSLL